jgi:polyhydroxybutyrate depolymerase
MNSGGRERTYIRYVPPGMQPGKAIPLVLDLAAYSPASNEESFSGFTKPDAAGRVKADDVGAVVITPEPVNGAGALLTWNYVGKPGWTDDQLFVSDLLDNIEAATCIDLDRVLVMGFAVGGVFGSILACDQADRFAALVTVSGLYSPASCAPSKPLPVLSFHGTADRFIPFDGGVGSGAGELGLTEETTAGMLFMGRREGALQSSQAWADHDGCTVGPTEAPGAAGVTRKSWTGCTNGTTVELCVIEGGEHTWPGSNGMDALAGLLGPVTHSFVANDVIWDFFSAHAR